MSGRHSLWKVRFFHPLLWQASSAKAANILNNPPKWTLNCAYTTNTRLYRPLSCPPSLRSSSMFWLSMSSFQPIIGSEPDTALLHIFAPEFPPGFFCHLSRKETEGLVEKAYSAMRSLRKVFWRTMYQEGQMTQVLRVDWVENWRLGLGMRVMTRKVWLEAEICGQGIWTIEDPGRSPRRLLMRRRRISQHKGTWHSRWMKPLSGVPFSWIPLLRNMCRGNAPGRCAESQCFPFPHQAINRSALRPALNKLNVDKPYISV